MHWEDKITLFFRQISNAKRLPRCYVKMVTKSPTCPCSQRSVEAFPSLSTAPDFPFQNRRGRPQERIHRIPNFSHLLAEARTRSGSRPSPTTAARVSQPPNRSPSVPCGETTPAAADSTSCSTPCAAPSPSARARPSTSPPLPPAPAVRAEGSGNGSALASASPGVWGCSGWSPRAPRPHAASSHRTRRSRNRPSRRHPRLRLPKEVSAGKG